MNITIEITETESVGKFSSSKTTRIAIPSLLSCDKEKEGSDKQKLIELIDSGEAEGLTFNIATFYLFCQRVAWGEATSDEIAFMSRMYDLIERRGDWNAAVNDHLAQER